jgi:hypothetical protein
MKMNLEVKGEKKFEVVTAKHDIEGWERIVIWKHTLYENNIDVRDEEFQRVYVEKESHWMREVWRIRLEYTLLKVNGVEITRRDNVKNSAMSGNSLPVIFQDKSDALEVAKAIFDKLWWG